MSPSKDTELVHLEHGSAAFLTSFSDTPALVACWGQNGVSAPHSPASFGPKVIYHSTVIKHMIIAFID